MPSVVQLEPSGQAVHKGPVLPFLTAESKYCFSQTHALTLVAAVPKVVDASGQALQLSSLRPPFTSLYVPTEHAIFAPP